MSRLSPLPVSERWCPSRRHPISGLFGRPVPAPLPRFTATCGARPRLTVGSTLDVGQDGVSLPDDLERLRAVVERDHQPAGLQRRSSATAARPFPQTVQQARGYRRCR